MDCTAYENLLFASFEEAPDEVTAERMRRHEAECPKCRQLVAIMKAEHEAIEAPLDMVSDIVASTSGSPCERAQELLAAFVGSPEPEDELMRMHVDACHECAAVERALAELAVELPSLAFVDPGEGFVDGVMAATVGTAPRATRRTSRRSGWTRLAHAWERLAQRPRIALEGAYAAAAVAVLIFGLPTQSLAEMPGRAFNSVRAESVNVERVVSARVSEFAELSKVAWEESTTRASGLLASYDITGENTPVPSRVQAWASAVRDWATRTWGPVLGPIFERIAELWNDNQTEV